MITENKQLAVPRGVPTGRNINGLDFPASPFRPLENNGLRVSLSSIEAICFESLGAMGRIDGLCPRGVGL